MIEKTVEQETETKPTLRELLSENRVERAAGETVITLRLTSQVMIFDSMGKFVRVDDDGEFNLRIDQTGAVTGEHSRPSPHDVEGTLDNSTNPPNIIVRSVDGIRAHTGALLDLGGERFIGYRLILRTTALATQEEGVWVGTKVG
jgi:hypothetical protein